MWMEFHVWCKSLRTFSFLHPNHLRCCHMTLLSRYIGDFYLPPLLFPNMVFVGHPVMQVMFLIHEQKFQKVHGELLNFAGEAIPALKRPSKWIPMVLGSMQCSKSAPTRCCLASVLESHHQCCKDMAQNTWGYNSWDSSVHQQNKWTFQLQIRKCVWEKTSGAAWKKSGLSNFRCITDKVFIQRYI